jgi:hypothetical protein
MRSSLLFASTLAALLGIPAVAQAQLAAAPGGPFATPPPAARPPLLVASSEKPALLGITAEGGAVFSPRLPTGAYGRLGVQAIVGDDVHGSGLIYGLWEGLEIWGTRGIGGGSMAVTGLVGWKAGALLATLGGGFNVLSLDKKSSEDHRYALGLLMPRASVRLGVEIDSVFVGVTGDVQRRFAWGPDGVTLVQGGLAIGAMFDPVRSRHRPLPVAAGAEGTVP